MMSVKSKFNFFLVIGPGEGLIEGWQTQLRRGEDESGIDIELPEKTTRTISIGVPF